MNILEINLKTLGDLYEQLTSYKYGIGLKFGIIPIYVATVLHLHRNNIVIKKGSAEQKLSADLLNLINDASFFDTLNGMTADYSANQAWWKFCDSEGTMLSYGVSDAQINGGETYKFVYTIGY